MAVAIETFIAASMSAQPIDPTRIVARLNGAPIQYGEIRVSDEDATLAWRLIHKQEPPLGGPGPQLEEARQIAESTRLRARIQGRIRETVISKLGIAVSEKEIDQRWNEMLGSGYLEKRQAIQEQTAAPLLSALTAVYDERVDEATAYKTFLQGRLTREQWQVHLRTYRTPELRKALADFVRLSSDSRKSADLGSRIGIRKALLAEKVESVIDHELERADPRFAKSKMLLEGREGDGSKAEAETYVTSRRKEWWLERYRSADVEILDPRYSDVARQVKAGGPSSP